MLAVDWEKHELRQAKEEEVKQQSVVNIFVVEYKKQELDTKPLECLGRIKYVFTAKFFG